MSSFALFPVFFESARGFELLGLLFTLWMLYECITRERNSMEKILWLLLIVFGFGLGPLIYFFVRVVKVRG